MLKWDNEYDNLCKTILKEGVEVENRTAVNTVKIPSYTFSLDVEKEFPILTTKKMFSRQAILEIMWIYLVQSNDVRWLKDRNVHIWDEWEINEDGYWIADQKFKREDGEFEILKVGKNYGKEWAHTIGTAYGYVVRKYAKTQKALRLIQEEPENRRNVVSLWHDDELATGVLEPCVWSHELDVTNGKLNMLVHQRSCDVPLGLPFNVTQYAALMSMYASVSDLRPGTLTWSIKDAHIYVNQIDGIKEQMKNASILRMFESNDLDRLKRLKIELERLKANHGMIAPSDIDLRLKAIEYLLSPDKPELFVNPEVKDFFKFDTSIDCKDVKVLKYKDMGKISFPIAQ